ncbi:hypothetical protein HY639_01520 [Candidatus Woesearchaeota archaeon]|nr:hypothetical protein [Candidatus Woesearchaeota archaeon]
MKLWLLFFLLVVVPVAYAETPGGIIVCPDGSPIPQVGQCPEEGKEIIEFTSARTQYDSMILRKIEYLSPAPAPMDKIRDNCLTFDNHDPRYPKLLYDPFCAWCDNDKVLNAELTTSLGKNEVGIKVPCKADVLLVTNSKFIDKRVAEDFFGIYPKNSKVSSTSKTPHYDTLVLNYMDKQREEGRTVRYIELDDPNAQMTFAYSANWINAPIPEQIPPYVAAMHSIPQVYGTTKQSDLDPYEITYLYDADSVNGPKRYPVVTIAGKRKGTTQVFSLGKIIMAPGEKLSEASFLFEVKDKATLAASFLPPYSPEYHKKAGEAKSILYDHVFPAVDPTYTIMLGDYDVIASPLVEGFEHASDDCLVMKQCIPGNRPERIIARLPTDRGDKGLLAFRLLDRVTRTRSISWQPSIVISHDLFDMSQSLVQSILGQGCKEPLCAKSPPFCTAETVYAPQTQRQYIERSTDKCTSSSILNMIGSAEIMLILGHGNPTGLGYFAHSYTMLNGVDITQYSGKVPQLVAANICWGAKLFRMERIGSDVTPRRIAHGVSTTFLNHGTLVYIGSTEQGPPLAGEVFLSTFFQRKKTIGEQYLAAKVLSPSDEATYLRTGISSEQVKDIKAKLLAYQLYGDPTLSIK